MYASQYTCYVTEEQLILTAAGLGLVSELVSNGLGIRVAWQA